MVSPVSAVAAILLAALASCSAATAPSARVQVPQQAPPAHVQSTQLSNPPEYDFDAHGVARVSLKQLGKSWHHGCPVPPRDLRALQVRFWGFDRSRHTGVVIVNRTALHAVRVAFRAIRHAHFPIRRVRPVAEYGASDNKSMAHDNTSAFNCRYAVANGPKSWSAHAYGSAVDIDPRENPYRLNGKILPPSGAKYADRSKHRRGMIFAGGPVVRAFDAVGWGWGGRWGSTPDYQHFSASGR
ncbi:MAG TPA: M15 family metallopeptidase [Mycobacteriales bacterium]|nr:M15 family metallopeptidase [Mycobacteriales bacterium]